MQFKIVFIIIFLFQKTPVIRDKGYFGTPDFQKKKKPFIYTLKFHSFEIFIRS